MGVQIPIILTGAKGAIFLGDKKEWGCLGVFGWKNASGFEVFFNEGLTGSFSLGFKG